MLGIGDIDAAFSLWDRFTKRNKPDAETDDENTVAGRFIQLFEKHGVHRNQIPGFFGHDLTYSDVANNQTLLSKLSPEILQDACDLFKVRLEWLEGADEQIYPTHNFYKCPEDYVDFIAKIKEEAGDNQLIAKLVLSTNTSQWTYDALLVIQEYFDGVGEERAIRYHLCNGWIHRASTARADLTACIAITLNHHVYMHSLKTTAPIELFCDGKGFIFDLMRLPIALERNKGYKNIFESWHPDEWVFNPESFVEGVEEAGVTKESVRASAVARLLMYFKQGLMETGYSRKSPEPEFRAYLNDYKSGGVKKKPENTEVKETLTKKGLLKYFTLKNVFFVAIPFVITYLAFFFNITSAPQLKDEVDKLLFKKELRVYSIYPTTADEDANMKVLFDDKSRNCETIKTKEDNRLVLTLKCDGNDGDTIDFTVTSNNCPETRAIRFGKLGEESEFGVKCN